MPSNGSIGKELWMMERVKEWSLCKERSYLIAEGLKKLYMGHSRVKERRAVNF